MNSTAISHRLQLKYVAPPRSGGVGETVSLKDKETFRCTWIQTKQIHLWSKVVSEKKNAWLGVRTLTLYDDRTQCSIQLTIWQFWLIRIPGLVCLVKAHDHVYWALWPLIVRVLTRFVGPTKVMLKSSEEISKPLPATVLHCYCPVCVCVWGCVCVCVWGGTPYKCHTQYVPPQTGLVFAPFWSENGYRFRPFCSGIGYDSRGNYGSVWMYLSFQFQTSDFFVAVLI